MNLRKTLSVVLSVAMMLSMMSIISFTTASAADNYTVYNISKGVNEDKMVAAADNLLANATMTSNVTKPSDSRLVDGQYSNVNVDFANPVVWAPTHASLTDFYATYTLDGTYDITTLVAAGSGVTSGSYGTQSLAIYAKAYGDITDADEPIYVCNGNITWGQRIDLDNAVTTNVLTFKLQAKNNAGNNQIWMSEFAAAGTEVVPPYTFTEIKDLATYEAKGIYGNANILKLATCSNSSKVLTDDIVSGIHKAYGDDTSMAIVIGGSENGTVKVTYTLPAKYEVTGVFVAGAGTGSYGTEALTVYDGAGDEICAYPSNVTYGLRVDFAEPVVTDKLVFELKLKKNQSSWQTWLSEFAAAGTEVAPPYTVSNITDGVNEDKIIAPENNILKDAVSSAAGGSLPAVMYDGKLCGVSDNWGWNDPLGWCGVGAAYPEKWYITWDLGGNYAVDSFLLAGSGVANSKYGANNLTIYVSDKAGAAAAADEPVYSSNDLILYGRHIQLKEAAVGRYVVYEVVGYNPGSGTTNTGRVWLSEVGATGTKIPDPFTFTEIKDLATYEAKGIYGNANILKTATCSKDSAVLTDDIVSGIHKAYGDDVSMAIVMSGGENGTVKVTYTLPAEYEVTSVFVAGAGTGSYGTEALTVYDAAGNEICAYPSNVTYGLRVDFGSPVVTDELVFELKLKSNAGHWQTWISEFAAAGTTDTPVKPPKTEKYNIVTIGDSITHGTYFDDTDGDGQANTLRMENTYSKQLEALLDANSDTVDYIVKNHGVSGTTVISGSLIGSGRTAWYDSRWNAAKNDVAAADAVTIMLGTNDTSNWDAGSKVFKQEYKKLVAAIREVNPDVDIYLLTSPAAYLSSHYDILAKGIVPMQLELAAELGLKVVDIYNVTRDLMRDGDKDGVTGQDAFMSHFEASGYCRVHPDEKGAAYIAEAMFDAFTKENNVHVSVLKSSATADADNAKTSVNGATTIAPDANRVTPLANNLLAAEGTKISGYQLEGGEFYLADGRLRMVNHNIGNDHNNGCANLVVDFGSPAAITQILLGGTQLAANNNTFLYEGVSVYVTDDVDNLGEAVWSFEQKPADGTVAGRLITLPEAVTGRYMVVKVTTKYASGTPGTWMSEIAAVGYRPEIAADALGGQVRKEGNALRFGFELIADGVAYADADPVANNNYARDIANATIVVGGKEYKLVDFGAIVSTNASSAMTLEAAETDATGKTKAVVANNLYDVDGDAVTYTAVVTNIPEAYYNTAIYARSYITYADGDATYTVYGDIINRTVAACSGDAIG